MTSKVLAWPRGEARLPWLRATADRALASTSGEVRNYAHFALEAMATEGHRRDARALITRLEARPLRDLVHRARDVQAIAAALLQLDDEPGAQRRLNALLAQAARQKKKSDGDFLRDQVRQFRAEHALLPAAELERLAPRERVRSLHWLATEALRRGDSTAAREHLRAAAPSAVQVGWGPVVVSTLLSAGDLEAARQLHASLSDPDRADASVSILLALGFRTQTVPLVKARAERALTALVPSEWNVHHVASNLAQAVEDLRTLGKPGLARQLLDVTLGRFATGAFDSRGFASAGAYLTLAPAAFHLRGWGAAEPLLARVRELPGMGRADHLHAIVSVALELGRVDEARAWARELEGPQRRAVELELAFAARDWSALARALAPIRAPAEAARLAWSVTSRLTRR